MVELGTWVDIAFITGTLASELGWLRVTELDCGCKMPDTF